MRATPAYCAATAKIASAKTAAYGLRWIRNAVHAPSAIESIASPKARSASFCITCGANVDAVKASTKTAITKYGRAVDRATDAPKNKTSSTTTIKNVHKSSERNHAMGCSNANVR